MDFQWQDVAALGVVLAAAAYLARHTWRLATRRKPPGCGGCAQCAAHRESERLVSIDPPKR